ncbi:MAG: hypothetical protein ACRDN0_11805, partial [Trebonia sp.]
MRRALAPAAVLAVAWPLLLAGGPGLWCPTQPTPTPTPAPAVATRAPAPAFTPPAPPAPAVPVPSQPSHVARQPAPRPPRRPARPPRPFTGRGDLLLRAPGGRRKG